MKIISYNVNGIRSALRKGLLDWIAKENPDVLLFQELKAKPEQIDNSQFEALGYHCFWFSAQKPGYSGVGMITKIEPDNVEYGIGHELYDSEGRLMRADFGELTVINTYFPSGSSGDQRQEIKMKWLEIFTDWIVELRKSRPKILISGDFNICRLWIDIHNPQGHVKVSGFLPEEREWFEHFISLGFIDTFREFDSREGQYTWWSFRQRSRERNKGWRIDYHIITQELRPYLKNAYILPDARHSDHCPVVVELEI